MTDSKITEIQDILADVDRSLRDRMRALGVGVAHILVAIGPDGTAMIRGNVKAPSLKKMGAEIIKLAEEAMEKQAEDEPIH